VPEKLSEQTHRRDFCLQNIPDVKALRGVRANRFGWSAACGLESQPASCPDCVKSPRAAENSRPGCDGRRASGLPCTVPTGWKPVCHDRRGRLSSGPRRLFTQSVPSAATVRRRASSSGRWPWRISRRLR
jgi:hypothetical protein